MQPSSDFADDAKYSQLAPMAIVALALGLASILALVGPLFYLLPIAAIGLALLALSKINNSDGAQSGARLAYAAIALATICLVASLVRIEVRDRMLKEQAAVTAQRWLADMTAGRLADVRALLSGEAASMLVPRPEPGAEPIPPAEMERMAMERLELDPLVRDYADGGAELILESVSEPISDANRTVVGVNFTVADAKGSHRHVQVQLARSRYYEAEGEPWRIDRWEAGGAHGAH